MDSKKQRGQTLTTTVEDQRGRVLSMIKGMVRDQTEAEDVLQDVFEEYVEAYDLGTAIESVGAWLMKVARNKVLDRFRRRKTREDYQFLIESSSDADGGEPDGGQTWLREDLIEALESLPEDQREVFIQHELEGKSFEEIAQEAGVSVNTLLSRKRYAVLALREYLKEIYDEYE